MNETGRNQQLTLLPSASVPARFVLSERTRRRGMQHIAQIRADIEGRRAADADIHRLPSRRPVRAPAA